MGDLDFVPLRGGTFLMGSTERERELQRGRPHVRPETLSDEGPQHEVEVSPFECMRYPVTRRLYAALMKDDPLQRFFEYAHRVGWSTAKWSKEPDTCPVVWVRWLEAVNFCN